MKAERWVAVPGFEGVYEVSDMGRVRRVTGRFLRGSLVGGSATKYLRVDFYRGGRTGPTRRSRTIHTLVAEAFLGTRPRDAQLVRHINGNPLDNRAENLAYGTYSDNLNDAVAHGTHAMSSKTHCKRKHEFTPENTYLGSGNRQCRICKRALAREYEKARPPRKHVRRLAEASK